MPVTRRGAPLVPDSIVALPDSKHKLHQPGCQFVSPSSPGMQQLKLMWRMTKLDAAWASTWLPTALLAHMPQLTALLQMLEDERAAIGVWLSQFASIDWSATDEQPELDGDVQLVLSCMMRRMQPLLRTGVRELLPWAGRQLYGRLVYACTATLLQQGREVVMGSSALGAGRDDLDVLSNLKTDADLGLAYLPVFSVLNVISPVVTQQLSEVEPLFSQLRRAGASSGPFVRESDSYVQDCLESVDGCCATGLIPPKCPGADDAADLLSCAQPESPGMVSLMLRGQIFIASGPVHHMHSLCTPETVAKRAKAALDITISPALLTGPRVQKEQSFPVALSVGDGGVPRLALRTATQLGVDTERLCRSMVGTSDLVFQLNPSAVNLAAFALQPSASSERASVQMALVAQVISLTNSRSRGRKIKSKRLLTDAQLEWSEALITASNRAYHSTLPKVPRYQ